MKKYFMIVLAAIFFVGCESAPNSINLDEAKTIALEAVDGQVVKAIEERDDIQIIYEIDIVNDDTLHEFEINGRGEIVSHERSEQQKDISNLSNNLEEIITEDDASRIAIGHVGGGRIVKSEYDVDDGVKFYEVEVIHDRSRYDLVIDAITGEMISYEVDD